MPRKTTRLFSSPKRMNLRNVTNIDRRRKTQIFETDSDTDQSGTDNQSDNQLPSPAVNRTFEGSCNRRRHKLRYSSFLGMDSDEVEPERTGDIEGDTLTSSTRSLRPRRQGRKTSEKSSGFNLSESEGEKELVIDEETKVFEHSDAEATESNEGELTKTIEKNVDERTRVLRKKKKTPTAKKSFAMQFDLTNKTPSTKSFGMQFNIDNKTHVPTPGKTTDASSFDLSATTERISEDKMITLTLPFNSPVKIRKKPSKRSISNDETETKVATPDESANGSEHNNETEINFKPRPKLPKPTKKQKKKKTVVHQTMAFTVADPGNLVEAATDEHEDFAFDLIAMFEIDAFALPNKWSTKSNFVEATNHIQQCMTIELQAQAEEILEERKVKGPPVTLGQIRGLIDQFDPIRKVKQYAKRLSRLDKTHNGTMAGYNHETQLKEQLAKKLHEIHS